MTWNNTSNPPSDNRIVEILTESNTWRRGFYSAWNRTWYELCGKVCVAANPVGWRELEASDESA